MEDLPTHLTQGTRDDRPVSCGARWMRLSLPEAFPQDLRWLIPQAGADFQGLVVPLQSSHLTDGVLGE